MVLVFIQNISSSNHLLRNASELAAQLGKTFGVLSFVNSDAEIATREAEIKELTERLSIAPDFSTIQNADLKSLTEICETNEVSFLFLQLTAYRSKSIQTLLNACRELRIPYLLHKDNFELFDLKKVIMPVNFLEEEVEKAQFASAFGRFCNSEVVLLQANDYGSKAARNVERMKELFEKFTFAFGIQKAQKDSFKVDIEAVYLAEKENYGLVIASASREYSLDDIIFGPKEQHMVKKSIKPVLLVNPRGDLYALCD